MPELSIGTVKDTERFIKLLIYGAPGVGKTTFVADAPNPIYLDFENSTEALRGGPHEGLPTISDPKQLGNSESVLAFLRSSKVDAYDTIIIDTISSMYEVFLMAWMTDQARQKPKVDRHIAYQQDFRKITNVLREIFYTLQQMEKHVVLIGHEKHLVDQETNRVLEIRPALPPSAEQSVERLINEVYYMEKKANIPPKPATRFLHVDSQGKILAKNRSRCTESKLENPTWKEVFSNGS